MDEVTWESTARLLHSSISAAFLRSRSLLSHRRKHLKSQNRPSALWAVAMATTTNLVKSLQSSHPSSKSIRWLCSPRVTQMKMHILQWPSSIKPMQPQSNQVVHAMITARQALWARHHPKLALQCTEKQSWTKIFCLIEQVQAIRLKSRTRLKIQPTVSAFEMPIS